MKPNNDASATPARFARRAVKRKLRSAGAWAWRHFAWSAASFLVAAWLTAAALAWRFEAGAPGANISSFEDALWWGLVTFLTVGYGDKYPVTSEGRAVAALLMFAGVACVGLVTAKVSSIFMEKAMRDGRGAVNEEELSGHFVVLGWNESMEELLTHILDFNRDLSASDVVVISNASPAAVEALRAAPWLAGVHVVQGDHFSESNIRRAAPERARKVLILADRTPSASGQPPTPTEIDARTIMAAMTVMNLARGAQVTAEVLDPKMDHYLKLANVTEIVYSSEYARLLLGNASSGVGIANIVLDLLDGKSSARLTSWPFPKGCVGLTYAEARALLEAAEPRFLVVGILENSGNAHAMKELALRRAQRTPDVAQLVENLKSIKDLRCNNPVFHPDPKRAVTEGSMAIVIAKREAEGETSREGESDVGREAAARAS